MAVGVLTSITNDPIAKRFQAIFTADGTPAASGIYCGFKPRVARMTQVAGTPDATSRTSWYDGVADATYIKVAAAGDLTIVTTNGFTITTGSEATVIAKATNSPNAAGPGIVIGTGPQAASLVYALELEG